MKTILITLAILIPITGIVAISIWGFPAIKEKISNAKDGVFEQIGINEENQTNEDVDPSGLYSTNELFALNRPLKCTWTETATDDKSVTNILYINGKKFYQDVTMGDLGHSYTVSDGDYLYIWHNFNDTASKMKIAETDTQIGDDKTQSTAGLDQEHQFACESWKEDKSLYIPPTNKDFKDVTEEMNEAVEEIGDNSENIMEEVCSMCRQAPTQTLIDECLVNAECPQ
ncbi:MAG: hypothetical protein AB9915_00460 [Candidatus Dojkabacteria bacterium]